MAIKKEIFDLEQIVKQMQAHWPSKKCNHKQVAIDYYNLVKSEVTKGIIRSDTEQVKLKLIPVNFKTMRDTSARYGGKGQQKYWFDWFQEHHSLMTKHQQGYKIGNKGQLTMIKFTRELEIMIADQDSAEIFKSIYASAVDTDIDFVDIDLKSLNNYINHTRDSIEYLGATDNRQKTLQDNLKSAELIKLISEFTDGQLPQIVNISKFGRKYYRGPNLQSASKMLRQAALGDCWQYDIEASVYAWKLDTAKEIAPNIKLPATLDYLQFKNKKRLHLAELVFGNRNDHSVKNIKRVITAVGFGARTTNTVWRLENGQWKTSAIKEIIFSNDAIKRLFNDPWFKEFVQEQDLITKLIFEKVREHEAIVNNELLRTERGLVSKNKTISYLYQQTEAKILRALNDVLERNGHKMLLLCHDGFYTKNRAPIADLRYELKLHLPSANLEEEHCNKFLYNSDQDDLESDHKKFIRQEEYYVANQLNKAVHRPQKLFVKSQPRNDEYFDAPNDYEQAYAIPEHQQIAWDLLERM